MAVLKTYLCHGCDRRIDAWSDDVPSCCGNEMRWMPTRVNTPEWGGPQYHPHLRDEPFGSRSELNRWAKDNGLALAPSADKHGGARNEEMLNLGKKYSYAGSPKS